MSGSWQANNDAPASRQPSRLLLRWLSLESRMSSAENFIRGSHSPLDRTRLSCSHDNRFEPFKCWRRSVGEKTKTWAYSMKSPQADYSTTCLTPLHPQLLMIFHLHTSAFTPSASSPPQRAQIILFKPNPTGTPTTTAPARTSHLTTPLAWARCSSLIVWPSTRRCSIPSFVEESSETRWPKEAFPKEGLCWALAQEDSSMGARFFCWEYGRVVMDVGWIRGRMASLRGKVMDEGVFGS